MTKKPRVRVVVALLVLAGAVGAQPAAADPPSGGATLYLSPTGSDQNPCTQAAPCASLQRAYDLAGPGDVVLLAAGLYPGQTVRGKRGGAGPAVLMRPEPGASVSIADLDIYADWIEIRDIAIPAGVGVWGSSNHATLRNIDMDAPVYIAGASDLSVIGGDIGPSVDAQSWITHDNGKVPQRVLIKGVHFHDFTVSDPSIHSECMLVIAGKDITFEGDTWTNCAIFDLSFGFCCSSPVPPRNVLIENNFFGASIQAEAQTTLQFNTNLNPVNYTILYNSSGGGGFVLDQGQPRFANVDAIGNATPQNSNCGRVDWSYNFFTGSTCPGPNNQLVADLGFVDPAAGDFHLLPGAPEIDAGDPKNYPATDWDGQTRPLGAGPDAGADEAR